MGVCTDMPGGEDDAGVDDLCVPALVVGFGTLVKAISLFFFLLFVEERTVTYQSMCMLHLPPISRPPPPP